MIKPIFVLTASLAIGLFQIGCSSSSTGAQRIDGTTSTMAGVEEQIELGEEQLEAMIIAMANLDGAEELDRAFRDYDRSIRDLESTSQRIRSRRVTMQTRATEHVTLWRSESSQLTNREAQNISEQRRQEFEETISRAGGEVDDLVIKYDDLIAKAKELRTVLSNDLTRQGVDMTNDFRGEIAAMARDLQRESADTRSEVRDARIGFVR